ncbi:MAG TPA: DUF1801 domain-containing protein [Candidatus Saccharimonadales bacterium]
MSTVEEYLSKITPPQHDEYKRLRKLVKEIAPAAEESISYGMPTFKVNGKPLIYFGAFKNHMSLFPTPGPTEKFKDKLQPYKVSKGTIQFTFDNPLPDDLIKEILVSRLNDIVE